MLSDAVLARSAELALRVIRSNAWPGRDRVERGRRWRCCPQASGTEQSGDLRVRKLGRAIRRPDLRLDRDSSLAASCEYPTRTVPRSRRNPIPLGPVRFPQHVPTRPTHMFAVRAVADW